MLCSWDPVKINQCPEVVDLSINNSILCRSCCTPSRKHMNVLAGQTVVSGDLVMLSGTDIKPWDGAAATAIIGIADCSAEATADCPGQVCVYVRDAVVKCGSINVPAGQEAAVATALEALGIYTAVTV